MRVNRTSATVFRACRALPVALLFACNAELSQRSAAGARLDAFVVERIVPADGAVEVARRAQIEIYLSRSIDRDSLGPGLDRIDELVLIERDGGNAAPVAGAYSLDSSDTRIVFVPAAPLATPAVVYRISILEGIEDIDGQPLDIDGSLIPLPSSFSTDSTVDATPPAFDGITGLEAVSSSAIRASWSPAADAENDPAAIFYRVYRSFPPAQTDVDFSAPAVETAAGVLDALITGLAPDQEYRVAVRAVDPAGNESANDETLSVRTPALPPDLTPPTFAGVETLLTLSTSAIEARWSSASDDRDLAVNLRYRIYLAPAGAAIDFGAPRQTTAAGVTQETISGLDSDTEYQIAVRAVDTSDNEDANGAVLEQRTLTSFAGDVFPIFSTPALGGCISAFCHASGPFAGGGLSLQTYADTLRGGNGRNPNTIVPGNAAGSRLLWRTDPSNPRFIPPSMPQGRPALRRELLDTFSRWIDQGAVNN
jgi:hypothetical protein